MTTRSRADPPLPMQDGDGAVEFMIELPSSCIFLSSHAPLAAFGTKRVNWSVETQARAAASLRVGGASFLSVGGASADVVQRKRR